MTPPIPFACPDCSATIEAFTTDLRPNIVTLNPCGHQFHGMSMILTNGTPTALELGGTWQNAPSDVPWTPLQDRL